VRGKSPDYRLGKDSGERVWMIKKSKGWKDSRMRNRKRVREKESRKGIEKE